MALQDWYLASYMAKLDRKRWDRDFIRDPVTRIVRPRLQPWRGGHLGWYFKSQTMTDADHRARADKAWTGNL